MSISIALLLLAQAAQPAIASPCDGDAANGGHCAAAIAAAKPVERARLLYDRAFAHNERGDAAAALVDLDRALAVDPGNRAARRERAYSRGLLGGFAGARADLERALALGGEHVALLKERAIARHGLGDITGALADRTRVIAHIPHDAVAVAERGAEYLWVGRFAEAEADFDHADKLASDDDARGRIAALRTRLADWRDGAAQDAGAACRAAGKRQRFDTQHLVATCSAAFLAASAPAERAELLDIRARAWAVSGDADAARADWQMAAANYSLPAIRAAYADAKRSIALKENAAAYIVLGDIAQDRRDSSAASDYWLQAYRLGERSEDLLVRLEDAGVDEPDQALDDDRLPGSEAPTV